MEIIDIQQGEQWSQYWALQNPAADIVSVGFKIMGYWNILYSVCQVATKSGKVNALDTMQFKFFA